MIKFAEIEDIDDIMKFIDREWKKHHILARDRSLFEYLYVLDGRVNFAISRESKSQNINGIIGFIPFDKARRQISLSIWKALNSEDGMIGMSMLIFIIEELEPTIIANPGINPKTIPLYRYLEYEETGKMKHFYRLTPKESYLIAVVEHAEIKKVQPKSNVKVREINSFEMYMDASILFEEGAIKKEPWYIKRRYFEHPVYEYRFFLLEKEKENSLLVIAREQEVGEAKCLRIVDLIGNYGLLAGLTDYMDVLLKNEDYEYIDCYVAGIEKEIFTEAGWQDTEDTNDIIPNYFAPFERVNIDLYYSSKKAGTVILRGDGDQDRPN